MTRKRVNEGKLLKEKQVKILIIILFNCYYQ